MFFLGTLVDDLKITKKYINTPKKWYLTMRCRKYLVILHSCNSLDFDTVAEAYLIAHNSAADEKSVGQANFFNLR